MPDVWTRPTVTAELAHRLVSAVATAAQAKSKALVVAVVDESGVLKAFLRMDGARLSSVQVAIDKAYTAVSGRPTHVWHDVLAKDEVLGAGARQAIDRLVTLGGGYPLVVDGAVIGALGVAGGHYTEDMAAATAGLDAVGLKSGW